MTEISGAIKIVTDDRVSPFIGYCLYCRIPEGAQQYVALTSITREARQCPRCKRVYLVAGEAVIYGA